jgi:hypothetical protein
MPKKGDEKEQPSGVEERLLKWAQILFKLAAQAKSNQPAQTRGTEKGQVEERWEIVQDVYDRLKGSKEQRIREIYSKTGACSCAMDDPKYLAGFTFLDFCPWYGFKIGGEPDGSRT